MAKKEKTILIADDQVIEHKKDPLSRFVIVVSNLLIVVLIVLCVLMFTHL
ncbi:hypothetical protein [Eubacterium oxidoreducens]|uniref:Uncharacterized protein n=1 Tax=Eubacterium oxidoreducens TaxID=1732 RepID=A0A1G6AGP9_EUBOX|nr:hypothetical protein [Eubacterium oxidoreducens]SDB07500.1 hypothetical protein SAMN02910417_00559 [Eubacterium oxidoreducens]